MGSAANIVEDARAMLALAAGPRDWLLTRQAWLARGAARLGLTYARAHAIWYRKVADLWASEWIEISRRSEALNEQLKKIEASNEALRLALGGGPAVSVERRPSRARGGPVERARVAAGGRDAEGAGG